jgi:hypothetical protein
MGFIPVFYRVLESHDIDTLTEEKAQEYYECSLDELIDLDLFKKNKRYIKVRFTRPKTVQDIDALKLWAEENEYTGKLTMICIHIWCRRNDIPLTKKLDGSGKYIPNIKLFYKLVETEEKEVIEEWTFPTDMYSGKIYEYYLTTSA